MPKTLIPGNPGRLNFIKPSPDTIKNFQNLTAFGMTFEVTVAGGAIYSYFEEFYFK
jgi:hypothetical protein